MTTATDVTKKTTQTTEDLIRESGLEKLASAPVPEVAVEYETVDSCDGHTWRRKYKADGQMGAWEDMGPTK